MAEYIEREALIERLKRRRDSERFPKTRFAGLESAIFQVKHLPADCVVEVVRCKDCKYFREYTNEYKGYVENADGDCYLRVMYSDDYQFDAVKYCDYCSMGAKMDGRDCQKDHRIVNPLTPKYSLRRRPPLTKEQLEQMRVEIDANNQNRGAKMDGKGEGEC